MGQRCLVSPEFHDQWLSDELEILTNHPLGGQMARTRSTIEIPVVIHVVWYREEENVSDEQIHSQLEVLNRDFQLANADTSIVPDLFKGVIGNPNIVFKLAETDPDGNPTNGITRTETRFENIGILPITGTSPLYYTEEGGKDAWDTKRYLNIWVADIPNTSLAIGYASRPGQRIPEEDGIIVDYLHFGTVGMVREPYHLGRTVVHEVGHYLNLLHVNGNDTKDCCKDDMVEDTPFQTNNYQECQSELVSTCDSEDITVNYMNLVDDECMVMFTKGQIARMMATLMTTRSELINPNPSVSTYNMATIDKKLSISPNPARHTITLRLTEEEENIPYQFINYHGQIIQEGILSQPITPLDISVLPRGMYIVIVQFEEGTAVKKLLLH